MIYDGNLHGTLCFLIYNANAQKGNMKLFFHFLYPKAFYGIIIPSLLCSPKLTRYENCCVPLI